jgi:hypothetical protein
MVAITTDTALGRYPELAQEAPVRLLPQPVRPRSASGGQPLSPSVVALRAMAVLAAVVVVVAVAVGTAALGRVLDSERGITTSAPVTSVDGG